MDVPRITERRAASAARQLLYHRRRLRWMEERMAENAAALTAYLVGRGEEAAVLPGGYAVGLTDAGGVAVSEPQDGPAYEQLELAGLEEVERV